MKEIVFDKNEYTSYKDFYTQIYNDLDGKENHDFDFCKFPLGYNADILFEFLWYYHNDNIKFILINFDKEKIKLQKNYEDYEYNLIIEVLQDFVEEYPNNKIKFVNEK